MPCSPRLTPLSPSSIPSPPIPSRIPYPPTPIYPPANPRPSLTLHPTPTAALLKIPGPDGKTYSLRQKNTSNALILLEPVSIPSVPGQQQQQQQQGSVVVGLRAFSTVHETVELVAEAGDVPAVEKRGKWHEKFARGR